MTVHLVGAGPGDPGLITRRGAELLAVAEVVVHDRLSAVELLDLAPAEALRVDVGKSPDGPSVPQERINALLVEHGRAGRAVVRLKGGDPFVFARGAEEAAALAAAGVPYEVVPGITSAVAVPAYAGIPVTQRYSSTSLTVVTGHEDPTKERPQVDWEAIAAVGGTIVILMGVRKWPRIAERLVAGGRHPDTPAAAVRWGTRSDQTVERATLATLHERPLSPPATIVVGDVAGVELDWFTSRPLLGTTVVVTRPAEGTGGLADRLAAAGARPVSVPLVAVEDPADGGAALSAAVGRLDTHDWVVFTSANAVERVAAAWHDARALGRARVAVVGPGTAAALERVGVVADLVPQRYVGEGLVEAFPDPPDGGGRVLVPRAAVARDVVPDGLRAAGWDVDVVEAYRTVPLTPSDEDLARIRGADAVTFASGSAVAAFVDACGADAAPPLVATIGPVTSAAARERGLRVTVEASPHTLDALVEAVAGAVAAGSRP